MERLTIEYDGEFVPIELCTIDREGGADDCVPCYDECIDDCNTCLIQRCFTRLAQYENAHEKIIKRISDIKASTDYPHNFKGQMVEDLEWVLSLINLENAGLME